MSNDAAAPSTEPTSDSAAIAVAVLDDAGDVETKRESTAAVATGPGTVINSRYRLEEPIPHDLHGATLWRATDQVLDRDIQITLLSGQQAPAALDGARRAALINDPHLQRILDVGTAESSTGGELHYIASEPLPGRSLAEVVQLSPLSDEHTRAIVGETAKALDKAAQRGVHHLALRPEAIHFSGDRLVISGLGVDAALAGRSEPDGSAADARSLSHLAYYGHSGHWPTQVEAESWRTPVVSYPTAPLDTDERVVDLTQVRPDAADDLVDLTSRAFTEADDHPKTPAELASELGTWDLAGTLTELGGPTPLATAVVAEPAPSLRTPRPIRQSVRSARVVNVVKSPGRRIARAIGADGLDEVVLETSEPRIATGQVPVVLTTTGPIPVASVAAREPDLVQVERPVIQPAPTQYVSVPLGAPPDTVSVRRRGINPTPFVLIFALAALAFGGWWAFTSLRDFVGGQLAAFAAATEAPPTPTIEPPATTPSPAGIDTYVPGQVNVIRPQIAGITVMDPAERIETAPLAIDGDTGTAWSTYTYRSAQFGQLKYGLAVRLDLQQPATVSGLTILTRNTGGTVEVYNNIPGETPPAGAMLAEAEFAASTEIELSEPIETDSIILWITTLPAIDDGLFRLDVEEITVR